MADLVDVQSSQDRLYLQEGSSSSKLPDKRLIKVIHMTGIAAQFIAEAFITPHCKLIILETMKISEFSL